MDSLINNRHILIVDDQLVNVSCLKVIFEKCNYRVSSCTRGLDVMAAVEKDRPDLILLDILMPEMDGYDVCEKLKASPEFSSIPVIFITALKDANSVVRCFELGGVDYITKPFNRREVLARVATQLKLQAAKNKLIELNEWKANLLSIISHDMRGPFNNFCIYMELLKENIKNPAEFFEKNYDSMNYSINNVRYMIDNMLEWAMTQREGFELRIEEVSAKALIRECFNLFEKYAASKEVELRSPLSSDFVFNSESRILSTVLRNIVQNAIKYVNKGGTVEVSARELSDRVEISVSDNGIGMEREKLESLFSKSRISTTPGTGDERGAGVGLMICSDLMGKCGGRLLVSSDAGKGSVFTVEVPKK